MRQDQARDHSVEKRTICAEEELAKERGQVDDQDINDFDDNQLKMGIAASRVWPGQNPNNESSDRESSLKEALDRHESLERESLTHDGRESPSKEQRDRFHHGPSTRNRRESPSKEQRDRRDQVASSKGKDKTADRSLDIDSREKLPGASSRSETRSQGQSESYDPYKEGEYIHDAHHDRHSHDGGQRPQAMKTNSGDEYRYSHTSTPSDNKHRRHAHLETRESHTAESTHNPERANSKGNSSKHKHASGKTSRTSEQQEVEQKRKFMTWMLQDPSAAYDYFLQELRKLGKQSDEWEVRVNLLTEEMLAGRDRFQPATDGDIKSKMNKLREDVKALAREMNPKQISEKTFAGTLEGKQLALAKVEKTWARSLRAPILQSSIWRVLIRHILGTPFVVFGKEGAQVEFTWRILFGEPASEHDSKSVVPSSGDEELVEEEEYYPEKLKPEEFCEKWKSMTAIRLKDKAAENSVYTGREAKKALQKMLYALSDSSTQPSEEPSWLNDLKTVLYSAIDLAVVMAQQRSRLELFVPDLRKIAASIDHCCDGKTMDFDEGVEGPLSGSPVLIVTPGLRKWGDGFGSNLASCVDLEAAQVKCI